MTRIWSYITQRLLCYLTSRTPTCRTMAPARHSHLGSLFAPSFIKLWIVKKVNESRLKIQFQLLLLFRWMVKADRAREGYEGEERWGEGEFRKSGIWAAAAGQSCGTLPGLLTTWLTRSSSPSFLSPHWAGLRCSCAGVTSQLPASRLWDASPEEKPPNITHILKVKLNHK